STRVEIVDEEEDVRDVEVVVVVDVRERLRLEAACEEEVDEIEDIGDRELTVAVRVAPQRVGTGVDRGDAEIRVGDHELVRARRGGDGGFRLGEIGRDVDLEL